MVSFPYWPIIGVPLLVEVNSIKHRRPWNRFSLGTMELVKAAAMQMEIHVSWVRTKMVLRCLNIMFLVRHIYIFPVYCMLRRAVMASGSERVPQGKMIGRAFTNTVIHTRSVIMCYPFV